MATDSNKENIADGLQVDLSFGKPTDGLSPKKNSKKSRSKSIGPGALEATLKEESGNRRKSAFIPAVKSILSTDPDEVRKRKEARRKSLANRRVSFAPEATLHTWDVIEYMRDSTNSSASSNSTRRDSAASQNSTAQFRDPESASDPPSTPPEQVEEESRHASSDKKRDLHQRKRRRSSGIPPMNFNNPEDEFSSSPSSASEEISNDLDNGSSDQEGGDATMELTGEVIGPTNATNNAANSSARLEAAIEQASKRQSVRGVNQDQNGEMIMEFANEEITATFKPWMQKPARHSHFPSGFNQQKVDPFSPTTKTKDISGADAVSSPGADNDDDSYDLSMDITRALGGIITKNPPPHNDDASSDVDATMEFTTALGNIQQTSDHKRSSVQNDRKRRRSSAINTGETQDLISLGSPAKRQTNRRASLRRRRSVAEESILGDETMDMTMAVGSIQRVADPEFVAHPIVNDDSLGDDAMDFTMAIGGIQTQTQIDEPTVNVENSGDDNEELSMEFTTVLGGIKPTVRKENLQSQVSVSEDKRTTTPSPAKPRKSPGRTRKSIGLEDTIGEMGSAKSAAKSPRKSPRKSLATRQSPLTPESKLDQAVERIANLVEFSPMKGLALGSGASIRTSPLKETIAQPKPSLSTAVSTSPAQGDSRSPKSVEPAIPSSAQVDLQTSKTASLSDSIKLLSTPRKHVVQPSPRKQVGTQSGSTPRKTATPKTATSSKGTPKLRKAVSPRKSLTPQRNFRVEMIPSPKYLDEEAEGVEEESNGDRIQLQDFLDMTNIRFMDLTTTKRRHTGHPFANLNKRASQQGFEESETGMDSWIVAAACTLPEYEMYQHACHELKRYISGGKDVVRQIEAEVYEDNPPLFREYLEAPADQRHLMDNQFKNMKTFARLKSKEIWYGWRSTLLNDLKTAILKTHEDFEMDGAAIQEQESLIDQALPELVERHKEATSEHKLLQKRADELAGCDQEELEGARSRLASTDLKIEEKRLLLQQLQQQLKEKEEAIELAKERKIECLEEIKSAEKVREECRGWSTSEVKTLQDRVKALESKHGWLITSSSADESSTSPSLTMSYLSDLQLFFHPLSFSPTASSASNMPISLTYIGEAAIPTSRPLTTTKRFFLQLLRATLHCLPQHSTSVIALLDLVKSGWNLALAISEGVQSLEIEGLTEERILGDELMSITTTLLLHKLRSKVNVVFDVSVTVENMKVKAAVRARVETVYGEKYNETRMSEFMMEKCAGGKLEETSMGCWSDAVVELRERLIARGRKGQRIDYD